MTERRWRLTTACWSNRDNSLFICFKLLFNSTYCLAHIWESGEISLLLFFFCFAFFSVFFSDVFSPGDSSRAISVSNVYIRIRIFMPRCDFDWFNFRSSHFLHFINFRLSRIHFVMRIEEM